MSCYSYQTLNYKHGVFDVAVDVTYILTMEDSLERHKNIKAQLSKIIPTSKIIVVYNKGYKKNR